MKNPPKDLTSVLRAMRRADENLSDAAIKAAYDHYYTPDEWHRPLSTAEAAAFLGVTSQTLSNWKNGQGGDCPPYHERRVNGAHFFRWGSRAELRAWLLEKEDRAA